ncbi:hypothetical protein KPH14_002990 [Odynerus spinipes]|uniref:Ig-like domain-containing protein n=1 Tax=Odynerus spinipes TaxID=1348599 RepID=A0AAD9VUA5_9HYME|nr:hypothetical protein KPH14_002990 [Odynerus spinipes]
MVLFCWIICWFATGAHAELKSSIMNHRTVVKVFRNDTVLLPCYVQDLGVQIRVKWWGRGTFLADSDDPRIVTPERVRLWSNRSLEISNIQPEDRGEYVCQASRPTPWGYVTHVHEIQVMYPPSVRPVPESGELEVNLKEEIDMECVVTGVPVPVVTWWTKDGEIPLLTNRPRLRFYADHRNRSGQYTCIANNGIGEPASATIDLRIKYKPEIVVHRSWVHASPGVRTQLTCKVTAWPEAEMEWYFGNKTIPYSKRIVKHSVEHNHTLVIRNVIAEDYGFYLCRASNSLGITEAAIELSGVAHPAVFKEVRSISKTAYNFIWEVDCYTPIIEYQFSFRQYKNCFLDGLLRECTHKWHKLYIPSGSNAIGPVHSRSFNLTGLAEASHYEAFIVSRNRYGLSMPSKIIRFATESAPAEAEDYYKTDGVVPDEKINSVIQLASMSQQSTTDTDNNGCSSVKNVALIVSSALFFSIMRL